MLNYKKHLITAAMVALIGLLTFSTVVLYYKLKSSQDALQRVTEDVVRLEDLQEKRLEEHLAIKGHSDSGEQAKQQFKEETDAVISASPNGPDINVLREVSNKVRERAISNPRQSD